MDGAGLSTPSLTNFLIMAGAFLLILGGALIWLFFFRKTRRRKRKYRHPHRRDRPATTLAQSGGLPPIRTEGQSSLPPSPNPEP